MNPKMKRIIGKGATVNKPGALTHQKQCVIEKYIPKTKKYEVSFDGPWVGFYYRNELSIDRPSASEDKP